MSDSSPSPAQPTPTSSPIPHPQTDNEGNTGKDTKPDTTPASAQSPPPPTPKLRLHLQDLTHPATKAWLTHIPDPNAAINTALANIVTYLYTSPSPCPSPQTACSSNDYIITQPFFTPTLPGTRSVTFIVRGISGVAYTTGTELDSDHKEIHFSLSYISTVNSTFADPAAELRGVITHELVHCYQHTRPTATPGGVRAPDPPSGLIEGIADFVRLKAGLAAPHWKRPLNKAERGERWDQGYQVTAFFLEWIEDVRVGRGAIGMLNDRLLRIGYVGEDGEGRGDDGFWEGLFGAGVLALWEEYGVYLDLLEK
ncbi:hypothetical protein AJ79_05055 [Helicocarpus griseus UAMH5409]|uniref:PBSP domain-containing protein n=1 Tax=Helicocarpus griseus UAMH5409 TaxID=1447875 RepID=A0A2B7XQ80_9EURO|nr:hypothetical protein AJ79_05055 [Helicocarpus griseus UAMH5409]